MRNFVLLPLLAAVALSGCSGGNKYACCTPPPPPPEPYYDAVPVQTAADVGPFAGTVHFAFDSSALDDDARDTLWKQSRWLMARPDATVVIEGHCDERGTRDYNYALGMRRATAVRDYLVSTGVEANRLSTVSYGEDRPIAQGRDRVSFRLNRRAESKTR